MNAIGKSVGVRGPAVRAALIRLGLVSNGQVFRKKYSDQLRLEAIRLYCEKGMSAKRVAATLSIKDFTIKQWMSDAGCLRSMSEAAALSIAGGISRGRSTKHYLWQSVKSGKWVMADSRFELSRMMQLDSDPSISSWDRAKDTISYIDPVMNKNRTYNPDFRINYHDGSVVIEEIKPSSMVNTPENMAKFSAANAFYAKSSVTYLVVTENEIGAEYIANMQTDGFAAITKKEAADRTKMRAYKRRLERLSAETNQQRTSRLSREASNARKNRAIRSEKLLAQTSANSQLLVMHKA